jgi:hypothetical protein
LEPVINNTTTKKEYFFTFSVEDPNSKEWMEYVDSVADFAVETNMSVQEKALECVLEFVKKAACATRSTNIKFYKILLKIINL